MILAFGMIWLSACQVDTTTPTPLAILTQPATQEVTPSSSDTTLVTAVTTFTIPPVVVATPHSRDVRLVYVKNQELWLWRDQHALRLNAPTPIYQPVLSPDGRYVAYQRPVSEAYSTIWMIDLNTQQAWQAVSLEDLQTIGGGALSPDAVGVMPYQMAWKPGSHMLTFNTQQVFQGPGVALLDDLNLYDVAQRSLTFLLLAGWGGMFVYSPDGEHIAISNPQQIILSKADGSEYRVVMHYALVNTYSDYRFYAQPVWSPAGREIIFALPPSDPLATPPQPTEIWRIAVDGALATKVGEVQAVPFFDTPITFAPTLTHMAFIQEEADSGMRVLMIAQLDELQPVPYASDALLLFWGWSPDGLHFIYYTGPDQQAWLGEVHGDAQPLTANPIGITNVRWVDATRFLFSRHLPEGIQLFLGDIEGGELLVADGLDRPFEFDFALVRE